MSKERIAKWDNLKFLLIVFVAIGHMISVYTEQNEAISSIYLFIYTFHMPAFVFVSGLLMKSTIRNKRYDKVYSYLIMCVIIKVLLFASKWIALDRDTIEFFDFNDVSWYALVIFVYALITFFLQRFSRVSVFVLAIALALLVGYDTSIGTYLSLSRLFVFFPFFFAGFCLDNESVLKITSKIPSKIISALILVAVLACSIVFVNDIFPYINILKGKSSYEDCGYLMPWGALIRLGYYAFSFIMVFAVTSLVSNVKTFLTSYGARTLAIYVLHFPIIYIVRDKLGLTEFLMKISPENYAYLSIIAALIIVFVSGIKPVNTFFNFLINPKQIKKDDAQ
ncbi:MAG: acyltransferase family protein [Eubacterium sp.]|nr:acyltransferase family protein [Eubacterium sp.]